LRIAAGKNLGAGADGEVGLVRRMACHQAFGEVK
jgi:hypothetical protein